MTPRPPSRALLMMTLIMGFASGLPLALSSGTLQAWLTIEGVDLKTLGWLTVLGLPYTYKFGWAPSWTDFDWEAPAPAGAKAGS